MQVCPLEFRYGREIMKRIFDEENKLQTMLRVEAALAKAHASVGSISQKNAIMISKFADTKYVKLERVKEIEARIKHDVMAVVKALSEQCGSAGKYVHLGATSNDIIDTATALQMKQAIEILEKDLVQLRNTFVALSKKYKTTIMMGRTHGQFAVPITFGLKMAVYALETYRHLVRLRECRPRICVGKMSGAVGTGAALGKNFLKIQTIAMKELGLEIEEASSQIVGRDRYAEFICVLANIATSIEKFATEVRNLQRSEIKEVAEAFDVKTQVGSSTMAHKQNPIMSENVCGLARIVRGFIIPTFENILLWHERDLTNSSAERFILPHTCILVDDILVKTNEVFANLRVYPEQMKKNIESAKGLIMAESVIMALVKHGMGRQEAHELIRKASMTVETKNLNLREILLKDKEVMKFLTKKELDEVINPIKYIGSSAEIIDKVTKLVRYEKL